MFSLDVFSVNKITQIFTVDKYWYISWIFTQSYYKKHVKKSRLISFTKSKKLKKMATIEIFNNRISLKCLYNDSLIQFCKLQPKYFYDNEVKVWSFPKDRMPYVQEFLEQMGYEVVLVDKRRYSTIGIVDGKVKLELGSHFKGFDSFRTLPGYKYEMGVVTCNSDQYENVQRIMNEHKMPLRGYDIQ